jgi:hypothetical protein
MLEGAFNRTAVDLIKFIVAVGFVKISHIRRTSYKLALRRY